MSMGPSVSRVVPPPVDLAAALARLEARWGSAAVRLGSGERSDARDDARDALSASRAVPTEGALAPVLEPLLEPAPSPHPLRPVGDEVVSTGFPLLDAVLGTGGLPRQASATIRGDASSGKTTLALRCLAEAQAGGSIAAYLDLTGALDPFEAVCRGVDLRWLVILRPAEPAEGFALAGSLLAGRAIDLLVVDLPARLPPGQDAQLRRLAAHARRIGARLIVLEPLDIQAQLHGALAESVGLRLELDRRDWIRSGRDVIGQLTEVTVAKNRFGPPGRRVELEIRYADDSDPPATSARFPMPPDRLVPRITEHASPLPRLAPSAAPPGARSPRPLGRARRAGRAALGARSRPRLQSRRAAPGCPPRAAAGDGP